MCVILSLTDHTSVTASKHLIMTSLWRRQPWHACASASAYVRMCGKWVMCTYVIKTSYICLSLSPLALQDSLCMSCRRVSDLLIEFSLDWRREAWNTKHFSCICTVCTSMSIFTLCVWVHIYTVLFCTHRFLFLSSSIGVAMFALAFSAYKLRNTLCEENIKYRK